MYVCVLHRSLQASSAALEATYTESRRAIDADNNRLREEWASLKSQLEEERKLVRDGSKITVRFLSFTPGSNYIAPDICARMCVCGTNCPQDDLRGRLERSEREYHEAKEQLVEARVCLQTVCVYVYVYVCVCVRVRVFAYVYARVGPSNIVLKLTAVHHASIAVVKSGHTPAEECSAGSDHPAAGSTAHRALCR